MYIYLSTQWHHRNVNHSLLLCSMHSGYKSVVIKTCWQYEMCVSSKSVNTILYIKCISFIDCFTKWSMIAYILDRGTLLWRCDRRFNHPCSLFTSNKRSDLRPYQYLVEWYITTKTQQLWSFWLLVSSYLTGDDDNLKQIKWRMMILWLQVSFCFHIWSYHIGWVLPHNCSSLLWMILIFSNHVKDWSSDDILLTIHFQSGSFSSRRELHLTFPQSGVLVGRDFHVCWSNSTLPSLSLTRIRPWEYLVSCLPSG